MDPGDQLYTLEEIRLWKTESLKAYLTKRGLSKEGSKEELVALCFSACKLKLPIVPTACEILKDNEKVYENILRVCGIPDPMKIYEGWRDEKSAIANWPPTFLSDITQFLLQHGDVSLTNSLLKDYKIGKAYEYFTSGWLQEVFYHQLKEKCVLRAKCTPSQRVKDDLHDCWVAISEETGTVLGAYCTCTAGLGQTCNHIAALLFRLEAANQYGHTSCTMAKCSWVQPKTVKDLEPKKIATLCTDLKKSSRSKKVKSRPLVAAAKLSYNPLETDHDEAATDSSCRDSLAIALRGVVPDACLFKGLPQPGVGDVQSVQPMENERHTESTAEKSNQSVLHQVCLIDKYDMLCISKRCTTCYDFLNFLPQINDDEIKAIENLTIGQHENENWHRLHTGRITSSKFYQVHTKVNSVLKGHKKDVHVDCSSLVKSIMCYSKVNPNIKSLKYGRETEPIAVCSYLNNYKKRHVNVFSKKCGIFIDREKIYLGATPDLLVSCSCCGDGLLEVKCPLIPECHKCEKFCVCPGNLPDYITISDGVIDVKKNHAYYAQVQGQLQITGRSWCDLYVYTVNGPLQSRITFNQDAYMNHLLPSLEFFFGNYVVPELVQGNLKHTDNNVSEEPMEVDLTIRDDDLNVRFFCPVCNYIVKEKENISCYSDRSIACDGCNLWFHFRCANVTQAYLKQNDQWFCTKCTV